MNVNWRFISGVTILGILALCLCLYFFLKKFKEEQVYFDNWDEAMEEPIQVEVMILRNQNLNKLAKDVRLLLNIRVLNLGNNQLTSLPLEIGDLQKLEVLNLSNNKLKDLPATIGNLKRLKILNLNGNLFSEIPKPVFALDSLSTLMMADNLIQEINLSGQWRQLRIVDFADNQISKVSGEMAGNKTLQKIDLQNNSIIRIPEAFFFIPSLSEIILRGNHLDTVTMELYKNYNLRNIHRK